jgi:hypothetical protein
MVSAQEQTPQRASGDTATAGRLFLLDLSDDRVVSLNSDGSDREVIVTECRYPDGIAVDVVVGHIYWTNMGNPKANDGSIERVDPDGSNVEMLVDASQGDPRPGPDARSGAWAWPSMLTVATAEEGLILAKVRTTEEFLNEPQYTEVLSTMPLITVEKIGDSEHVPFERDGKNPLDGRLVLTRVERDALGVTLDCEGSVMRRLA